MGYPIPVHCARQDGVSVAGDTTAAKGTRQRVLMRCCNLGPVKATQVTQALPKASGRQPKPMSRAHVHTCTRGDGKIALLLEGHRFCETGWETRLLITVPCFKTASMACVKDQKRVGASGPRFADISLPALHHFLSGG